MRLLALLFTLSICYSCKTDTAPREVKEESKNEALAVAEDPDFIGGERIDGPANVRREPNGELKYSLADNLRVQCTAPTDGWCEISFIVSLTKEQFDSKESGYKKGELMIDGDDTLGTALSDIKFSNKMINHT